MNVVKPRILLISSEFPPNVGGIGNHANNLARALSSEGFIVTVLADVIEVPESGLKTFASQQNFRIVWVKRKRFVPATYLQRISKALQLTGEAEKVICSGKFSLWLGMLIRMFYPTKELVAVVHGSELDLKSHWPKKITDSSLRKFNKIIAVSNYTLRFLPKALPANMLRCVIANGINCSEFVVDKTELLAGEPALVTIGSVTERKGQQNGIAALPGILSRFPKAAYHIIGKPVLQDRLKKQATALGVESRVCFHGALPRKELLEKFSTATVKLMLSNHTTEGDFEGFGIAVLEANALGIPVVGSRNSGIANAIADNKTGILVDPHNPAEIVKAIEIILSNYSCFSGEAKKWAIQHDWKNIVKEYIAVLNARP